ncbi:MAG: hypothetical protein ACXWC1_33495 [Burkholderiales bacterium]
MIIDSILGGHSRRVDGGRLRAFVTATLMLVSLPAVAELRTVQSGLIKPFPLIGDAVMGCHVTLHGSWNRAQRTGYKVIRLLFDGTGKATGEYEDFMTGFIISDKQVWGRPVGVAVAQDGSLFVTEDGSGTIWRVSHRRAASN